MKYIKVAIDNVSDNTDMLYTYKCSDDDVCIGSVVKVPFGSGNRIKTGFVFEVSDENTEGVKYLKNAVSVEKEYEIPEDLINLCSWMKDMYLCRYIDGIKCVMPVGNALKRGKRKDIYENLQTECNEAPALTDEQRAAVNKILPYIYERKFRTFLLNGVTSSGKTEVYMNIADEVISRGRDVIILVPEISLTPQTVARFTGRFGVERVAVLHSRLTKGQRYDQWMRVKKGGASVLIGARSGIFAPFSNLGAIIIDEEHESSYKSDKTPKYDTIDLALQRGEMSDAVVILGTATPSVVTRFRAESGMYEQVFLRTRYNRTPLPDVEIADMRAELKSGNRTIFSRALYNRINESLSQKKQAILFLNRRGYSSFISCRTCGYVMKCPSCDVSLTYHKSSGMAECHFCGRNIKVPEVCPSCGGKHIRHFGIGTEKVEEITKQMFPEAAVARLDLDTARKKGESEKILNSFKKGKTDILVGTQLVAKGLDFANVGTVGIIAADITLNIPDYRSGERTFQLIVQAAGRAGRGTEKGNVVIQTYDPDENAIKCAAANDYDSFYKNEIRIRSLTGYPPFTDIIRLVFSGEKEDNVRAEADDVCFNIKNEPFVGRGEVFSPQPAYMAFFNDTFRYHIIIKSPPDKTDSYLDVISRIKALRCISSKMNTNMLVEINPYSFS